VCRHLAYLGPPVPLAELVLDPPHSLYRQSWAPADMRQGGTVNADGFGLGWFASEQPGPIAQGSSDARPVRYRRSVPIWADESLPGIARTTYAGAVLAAVRSGTTGMPVTELACAPFTDGKRWLFSHNGVIAGWPESVAGLAEKLPVADLLRLDAPIDSAVLWALLRHRLDAGEAAADAVRAVVLDVARAAPGSRLNVLLTDGRQIVATAWWHSLAVRRTGDAVAVSSEPWDRDDQTWQQVPDRQLVLATRETLEISPMEGRP
jgi:gamma-glutamyl hercynylcysteine S-oxide hydrolase